ncbi:MULTISPECIES: transglutaminase N-terminal domain-containing protein [unclassified Caballeronia]|uniref:transglutaminase N-terminal domain-containing protein n=1 Tax=unclassified Caballeronia TaxID=2646786 RepID=UPI002815F9EA|nr:MULTISPECIES: transglutaminase N-terminal domain-containing protein [unclassified Caballeronia]
MMFRPRASHDLRLLSTQLLISPTPDRLHWLHDVFDNSVAVVTFSGEASELVFRSEVTLEHYEAPRPIIRWKGTRRSGPSRTPARKRRIS